MAALYCSCEQQHPIWGERYRETNYLNSTTAALSLLSISRLRRCRVVLPRRAAAL
jgi:hypothetical protein